ncbi:MAG: ABC transporter ATP-binding protein [Rhodobacteraceae bacterium]|nr:ABC transporter ATP-binding protein [Paracoccaceae bacterium]
MHTGITIENLSKNFGDTAAISDVSLVVPQSSFTVLLGPSGCGKSTLLRLISGLETPCAGRIWIDGKHVENLPANARNLSMVFQSYALFPHLNVAENILFGLQVRKVPKAEQAARLQKTAGMMGLEKLLSRRPSQLSGGQQQRVALARAVIAERPICLMDEPLSNLDAKLRAEMRREIRDLQKNLGLTMVYVTHDQVEAITMADQVVLLNNGAVEQVATPGQMYDQPATTFAARFIGTPAMNLIKADTLNAHSQTIWPEGVIIGVRPEDVSVGITGVSARVTAVEYLGADRLLTCQIGPEALIARISARDQLPGDGQILLKWPATSQHLFDANSGQRFNNNQTN